MNIYRNESLIQMEVYETDPAQADNLVNEIRMKWAMLREKGYAGDYPVEILRNKGEKAKVVEIFKWKSKEALAQAQGDLDLRTVETNIAALATEVAPKEQFTQAIRGFNHNFPKVGGVELLKGVCSCLVSIDGLVENFQMSVKNGIVLMHRSPGIDFDNDARGEMYLKILMHGGEQPGKDDTGNGFASDIAFPGGPIRVEQNFNRPNDGIVKSNGEGATDFPGTAIWRVAWRIQTMIGPILTDPDRPLIFGPATVSHYPPVGTHFHSSTGPVDLIHEITGAKVGTLTPGELTAFDIVTTKDDEVYADILNTPPADIFEILGQHTMRSAGD